MFRFIHYYVPDMPRLMEMAHIDFLRKGNNILPHIIK